VSPVAKGAELKAFLRLPWEVYAGDSNWVPPLLDVQPDCLRQPNTRFGIVPSGSCSWREEGPESWAA